MTETQTPRHAPSPPPPDAPSTPWGPLRVLCLFLGVVALLASGVMAATAGVVHHVVGQHRDGTFVSSDATHVSSSGHAVTLEDVDLDGIQGDWVIGTTRLRVTSADPNRPVFVGIAPAADAESFLEGVRYSTVTDIDGPGTTYEHHQGGSRALAPGGSHIWVAQASGTGTQTVHWKPREGRWILVVMNQDGSSDVDVTADGGATVPVLTRLVNGVFVAAAVSCVLGVLAIFAAVRLLGGRRVRR